MDEQQTQEALDKLYDILEGVTKTLRSLGVAPEDILDFVEMSLHEDIPFEAFDDEPPDEPKIIQFPGNQP